MSFVFQIADRQIGPGQRPYLIAEMSGNHNRSLDRALQIVDAAAESGADAIKLQTYTADTMTLNLRTRDFVIDDPESLWNGRQLYELYEEAHTPWDWHAPIMARARGHGSTASSTPFDFSAVDFLETLEVPAYKIASFENTDLPLIEKAASTGKPMIISNGMASVAEIGEAVAAARRGGARDIVLLKCTSTYPATPENSNLATIPNLAETFGCTVGLSDHTMGCGVCGRLGRPRCLRDRKAFYPGPRRRWRRQRLFHGAGRVPDDARGGRSGLAGDRKDHLWRDFGRGEVPPISSLALYRRQSRCRRRADRGRICAPFAPAMACRPIPRDPDRQTGGAPGPGRHPGRLVLVPTRRNP